MGVYSDALDTLRTRLGTIFPSKSEMTNPYDLEDNSDPIMRDSYGLKVDSSVEISGALQHTTTTHTFVVVISREVIATDNNPDPLFETVKSLKDDSIALRKDLLCLNIAGVSALSFIGDEPIELVINNKFATMEISFTLTIFETL